MLLAAACVSIVLGAMLQAATGFGFSLLAAPLTFAALEPAEAVGLLTLLGTQVNLMTIGTERRRPQPLRRASVVLLAFAAPGAFLGVAVLRALPAAALQVAVTLGVAGTLLARRVTTAHVPAWLAGFCAGALATSTTTSGPPLLLHLLGRDATPEQVRDTLSVTFLGLSVLAGVALAVTGTPALPDAALTLGMVPAVACGHLVGRRGFQRLAAGHSYEPLLTGVLLVAVVAGLVGALT